MFREKKGKCERNMLCPVLRAGSVGHAWVLAALESKPVLCTTYNGLREEQENTPTGCQLRMANT
tara:strand:+ start:778 stop:969 length:192 start_codon:yes stop_codon:yes gene_type:complete